MVPADPSFVTPRFVLDGMPVPIGETLVIVLVPPPPLSGPIIEIDVEALYRDRGLPWNGGVPRPVAMADVRDAGEGVLRRADGARADVKRRGGDAPSDAKGVAP